MRWAAGWVFLVEMEVISVVLGAWLARHDPALLEERMKFPVRRNQSAERPNFPSYFSHKYLLSVPSCSQFCFAG